MIDPSHNDRRPPISPRLALRVAILGGLALVLFAVVFFRLWYLQVLSGDSYRAEANQNRTRLVRIQAPRGEIKDRDGRVLVENRQAIVVELEPQSLPDFEREHAMKFGQDVGDLAARRQDLQQQRQEAHRVVKHTKDRQKRHAARARARAAATELKHTPKHVPVPGIPHTAEGRKLYGRFARLGNVLHLGVHEIQARVMRALYLEPYANVRLKSDVSRAVYGYMLERADRFPGIDTQPVILRHYPKGDLAAQLFGTVGEISPKELEDKDHYRGVKPGTIVGQSGIEKAYDKYLRGQDGDKRISVDASGNAAGRLQSRPPVPGKDLRLSLDLGLQEAGQQALSHEIALKAAPAGAFVAMDPSTGDLLAMGSLPSFDPDVLTRPLTQDEYDAKLGAAAGYPQLNRATQSSYPTGSTFKPITAIAAMESGVFGPYQTYTDTGVFHEAGGLDRYNAGHAVYGTLSMAEAIKVSSDVFFYNLGYRLYYKEGLPLQVWAHKLGLGRYTGIDIPGENKGIIPGPAYREERAKLELSCRKEKHVPSCGYGDGNPDWREGDEVNTAIGQGDVQATPLQLAVAYAAIANGGKVVTPHVGRDIEDDVGRVIQKIERGTTRHVDIDSQYLQVVREGLHAATSQPHGTSYDVFQDWPQDRYPVYGKTGTAETGAGREDQSWYVCYVDGPKVDHPIVVAVTIEHGGFGAEAAAPVAKQILAHWYGVKGLDFSGGSSVDG